MIETLLGDLPPTRTHRRRSWQWVRTAGGERHDGLLTVEQSPSGTPGCRVERDVYAVQEYPAVGYAGRCFLLLNLDDPDQPDVYQTLVGPRGPGDWSCTCKAGSCGLLCKHVTAIRTVIAEGGLPHPSADAPESPAPSESELDDMRERSGLWFTADPPAVV
jgi:hypothetical protein